MRFNIFPKIRKWIKRLKINDIVFGKSGKPLILMYLNHISLVINLLT